MESAARRQKRPLYFLALAFAAICMMSGIYLIVLTVSPAIPIKNAISLDTTDDAQDTRDRIQIEKISVEVPIYTGGAEVLEKGVWHRYPDRGDPEKGGNFILSAHRFRMAGNPVLTHERSPFYNLDKVMVGDKVRIFFQGEWYGYVVSRTYSVKPNEISIEDPTSEAKLTLYSCTLSGSSDGRIVVEAKEER